MNILVVCQYFYPEEFKVNELVEGLINRGHNVTVLTGKPNYPKGPYPKGYRFWGVMEENYKGAKVIRVPESTRGNGGFLGMIKSLTTFLCSSVWYSLTHKIPADVVICFQLSPVTMAIPALISKKKNKAKLLHWVQDLWPESVTATTPIKNGPVIYCLNKLVTKIYKKSDYILTQSKSFINSICQKGDFADKIIYAPNWADEIFTKGVCDSSFRLPFEKKDSDFIVMFAGNIGVAQDFDNIIKAATLTKDHPNIKWIVVGDGRYKSSVEDSIKEQGLTDTMILVGRYPVDAMPFLFNSADVMLVSLKDEYIFSLTIPSKIQAYMAFGKPIVAMLSGEGKTVVEEADCGLTSQAEDPESLAKNVIRMSKMASSEIGTMGKNAKEYYQDNFAFDKTLDRILELL